MGRDDKECAILRKLKTVKCMEELTGFYNGLVKQEIEITEEVRAEIARLKAKFEKGQGR